jgi:hypothetical protein
VSYIRREGARGVCDGSHCYKYSADADIGLMQKNTAWPKPTKMGVGRRGREEKRGEGGLTDSSRPVDESVVLGAIVSDLAPKGQVIPTRGDGLGDDGG